MAAGGSTRSAIFAWDCGAAGACVSAGGLIARSCGFWRIKIAAPATATTTPRTTAAAIHSQVLGLLASTPGAMGRWASRSGRAAEPGRSISLGTSGAPADCRGSSGRITITGGAAEACASSALVDRTALVRSSAVAGELSSFASFTPTRGAAAGPAFDAVAGCGGLMAAATGAGRAGGRATAAGLPAGGIGAGGIWD